MLLYAAVCCTVLLCVAAWRRPIGCFIVKVSVCYIVLQCVVVCCRVLQCVAVWRRLIGCFIVKVSFH